MEILNFSELFNLLIVLGIAAAVAGFMAGLLGVLLWFQPYIMLLLY